MVGHRFGFAEDTVRLAAALRPALGRRAGSRTAIYVDNGSAFVDAWLLRACATLGIRLVHSTPGRPQGRGKIERFFRTVREQFLVEITAGDGDPAGTGRGSGRAEPVVHRLGRDRLPPPGPLRDRAAAAGPLARRRPVPAPDARPRWPRRSSGQSTRTVTKTAPVSLHGNTYQVDPLLVGRRVELVFDPFDLTAVEVRCDGPAPGTAIAAPDRPPRPPQSPPRDPSRATAADRPGSTTSA